MASTADYLAKPEDYRQKLAMMLAQSGMDYSPVRSPWQGAARLAQALLGGLELRDIKQGDQQSWAKVADAFGGDQSAPQASPNAQKLAQALSPETTQTATPQPSAAPMQFADLFKAKEGQYGLPAGYLGQTARVESNLNPNAQNPNSTAGGLFQFIDKTAKEYGLTNKNDPEASTDAAARLAQNNAAVLKQKLGRDPTPQELYLAHQQGATGAANILGNPGAAVGATVGNPAANLNGGTGINNQQFAQNWATRFNAGAQPPTPNAQPIAQAPQGQPQSQQQLPANIGGQQQSDAKRAALLNLIRDPNVPESFKSMALQQLNPQYGFQKLDNGTILRTDPRSGTVQPIYDAPVKPELKDAGTDPITGAKSYQVFDPKTQTLKPVGPGGTQTTASPQGGMLAPGVTEVNHSLNGDDYLNQFGPEVKAAVKAYINGDVMPTGNPRLQAIANFSKTIAQKYGLDTGTPVSDSLYSEKRKYRTELGSNSANSAGGQVKAFNQAIEHADVLATTLEQLGNYNLKVPALSSAVNYLREAGSTDQAAIATKARGIGQTLAGEVGKLFSGSAGGGVHERELTRDRFNTVKSGPELAGALEATIETMRGGLTALEQRRDQILGPNNNVKFVTPETETKIARIQEAIDRLRSGTANPAQQAVPQSAQPAANPQAVEAEMRRRGLLQ